MIRPGRAADAQRIAEIHIAAWQAAYSGLLPDDYLAGLDGELGDRIGQWEDWLSGESDRRRVLVAERGGELVGFVHAGPAGDRDLPQAAEIYAIYVDPAHWEEGWGSQLMAAIQSDLEAGGFSEAALWVMTENKQGRGFYEHLGWEGDGSEKDQCMGLPVPAVRYRVAL